MSIRATLDERSDEFAVSLDTLVEGTHFLLEIGVEAIAYKALAVNLSDMAAMAAEPLHINVHVSGERELVASSIAAIERNAAQNGLGCLSSVSSGERLCISIEILGRIPAGAALLRSGASPTDAIWVSGTLGDAKGGLEVQLQRLVCAPSAQRDYLLERLHRPTPRLRLASALRGIASACIDVSDGLVADLGHILTASGLSASLERDALPLSSELIACAGAKRAVEFALSGGDDYELCFCAPRAMSADVEAAADAARTTVTRIGELFAPGETGSYLRLVDRDGRTIAADSDIATRGFDHFG